MKIFKLYLLAFLLISESIYSQNPTFSVGESNSTTDFFQQECIGETQSEYLVLSYVITISSVFHGSAKLIKDLKIAYFDKNTLNKTKLLDFPEFEGEGIERNGKVRLEELEINGETLNLFTSTWDKDQKNYAIHVWPLDVSTLKPLSPRAKLLARVEDEGRKDTKLVTVEYLKFIKQFAIIYNEYKNKTKETTLSVILLDEDLNPVSNKSLTLQGTKHGVGIKDIDVDRKGNIYFVNAVAEKKNPSWDDKQWIRVSMIPASGDEITTADIELTGGNAINGLISVMPNDDVFLCGHYALLTDPKDSGKEFFAGSYIAQISPESGEVIKTDELELTDNQKKALYARSMKPMMQERTYFREMNSMVPYRLIVDDAGNTTMVGSVEYNVTTTSGRSSRTYFYYNSILVSKFNNKAEVAWQTMVPRSSFIASMDYALKPLIYFDKGSTYVIFNDDEKNIPVLSEIASGKKSSSKSSSGKDFKPKDYPPTDTDEIQELENWNLKNVALRLTSIDPMGFWKVNWLTPEGAEEKDKVPAIEGMVHFHDMENHIITTVYTKYGSLGLRKAALARITVN